MKPIIPKAATDLRSPLAKARDAWLESEEGKRCCNGNASGHFLQNRLELAFVAGANWAAQHLGGSV